MKYIVFLVITILLIGCGGSTDIRHVTCWNSVGIIFDETVYREANYYYYWNDGNKVKVMSFPDNCLWEVE